MRNILLEIEYDGTNYCGWQVQRKALGSRVKTIQEVIENVLHKILQEKVHLTASGRTDSGVHALAQAANFKTKNKIPLQKLQKALNSRLPKDIAIKKSRKVNLDFHARFGAKSKVYRYLVLNSQLRSAFLKNRAYFYSYALNMRLMRQEARALLGKHDFKAFCASGSSSKNTARTIKRISIKQPACYLLPAACQIKPRSLIVIDIEADGFLYNMVRNIVGSLLEAGRGHFPRGSLKKILFSEARKNAGPTAPASGLYLARVKY